MVRAFRKAVVLLKKKIMNQCVQYLGDYSSWEEACKVSEGYDSDDIFEKTCAAALAVRDGQAAYERDSFLFYKRKYNIPLMKALEKNISANRLCVFDFGGGLGSTYYQNRRYFEERNINVKWYLAEQEHFVKFGQEQLQDSKLIFVKDCTEVPEKVDVVLFSSVLQYLSDYESVVKTIVACLHPKMIILERTPIGEHERIITEKVKEPIYNATYPFRSLTVERLDLILNQYERKEKWHSLVDSDTVFECGDFIEFLSIVYCVKLEGRESI